MSKKHLYKSDLKELLKQIQDIRDFLWLSTITGVELDVLHSQLVACEQFVEEKLLRAEEIIGEVQ